MKLRIVAALALVGLSTAPSSDACINGVELEIERFQATPAGQVALAEGELAHDHPVWAAARVREQFPQIRSFDAKAPPLGRRAVRLYALAIVRSGGKIDEGAGWTSWGNREWALETLRDLEASTPNNPARQAELAEAQIALTRTRAAGVRTIEDLDGRDLLGSPYAYLALAKARQAQGDEGGTLAAVRRCAMMSSDRRRCEKPRGT
ncbi:MAG: hypothetical protein JWP87_1351 [Labilithrix sp.]|nr:hypothetical protein [Labilithrix sp.]